MHASRLPLRTRPQADHVQVLDRRRVPEGRELRVPARTHRGDAATGRLFQSGQESPEGTGRQEERLQTGHGRIPSTGRSSTSRIHCPKANRVSAASP